MFPLRIRWFRAPFALVALAILAWPAAAQSDAHIVYLVRHAERAENGTGDPPISRAGEARAELLSEMLRDAGVTHVHSTDYTRTRSTGAPAANANRVETQLYDPRDLPGFAEQLRASPGRHLVVGHSNTTPELVAALGGEPGGPIDEMEYDRLYILTITDVGVSTVLLRFGERFGS